MANRNLRARVSSAAEDLLTRKKYVAPIDLLVRLGWLRPELPAEWRQGRVPTLTDRAQVVPERLVEALSLLAEWASARRLAPEIVEYVAQTRDRRTLRFAPSGDDRVFRTHWLVPEHRDRLVAKHNSVPDIVVTVPQTPWTCASCGGAGDFAVADGPDGSDLCRICADLDHLVFLPAGNTALTRRAKRESGLSAVVVRWNRRRKRYERRGILVEEAALERAEELCLADEEVRARRRERDRERRSVADEAFLERFAAEILRLFPGCPPSRASEIALHAGLRGSGRVGRSAAAKEFDEMALTLAVVASIRHRDTAYDELLMARVPREEARERIRPDIDRILDTWRAPLP